MRWVCRYRKLSAKIHPDKLRDVEEPRLAFEEVSRHACPLLIFSAIIVIFLVFRIYVDYMSH